MRRLNNGRGAVSSFVVVSFGAVHIKPSVPGQLQTAHLLLSFFFVFFMFLMAIPQRNSPERKIEANPKT